VAVGIERLRSLDEVELPMTTINGSLISRLIAAAAHAVLYVFVLAPLIDGLRHWRGAQNFRGNTAIHRGMVILALAALRRVVVTGNRSHQPWDDRRAPLARFRRAGYGAIAWLQRKPTITSTWEPRSLTFTRLPTGNV
jgi:hypothetical protein